MWGTGTHGKGLCITVFKRVVADEEKGFGRNVTASAGSDLLKDAPQEEYTSIVEVMVQGRKTKALMDSGSCCTLVSDGFRKTHGILAKMKLARDGLVDTFSVNGEKLELLGTLVVEIQLGSVMFSHRVFVAKQLPTPVLIGWDVMLRHGMVVNGAGGFVEVNGQKVQLLRKSQAFPQVCRAAVLETVTVPGRSEVVVTAEIRGADEGDLMPDGFAGWLEPNCVFHNEEGLMVARTVSMVMQGRAFVRVMNVARDDIVLNKGIPLGVFQATNGNVVARLGTEGCPVGGKEESGRSQSHPRSINLSSELIGPMIEGASLGWGERRAVVRMVQDNANVFSRNDKDIGRTGLVRHSINVGDSRPVKQVPRRVPINYKEEVERQTKDMLEGGVIEESESPWSSPVVLVKKKDGSLRYCIDYRKLNECTKKDAHPLPRIDDCLDTLGGAKYFSVVDLTSGYWQVEVEEEDREKTAFSVGSNLYQFRLMPFGLSNAPATFQRLMQMVLAGIQWKECLVFLDDVIIHSKDFEGHMEALQKVFSAVGRSGLKLKPKKCRLFQSTVTFLGHTVSEQGVGPDPANVVKVENYPRPRNVTEVKSFLGLASYYRRFIKDFAQIANPLTELTKKDKDFEWSTECEVAFGRLKGALVRPPVLAYPTLRKEFQLYTDASNVALGAVLSQEDSEGLERVIAYESKTLSASERNYSTFDKEFLAIVWAVDKFRPYLLGVAFTIITDHKPLVGLKTLKLGKDPTGRRDRWCLDLSLYDCEIRHRSGTSNGNADALSRIVCSVDDGLELGRGRTWVDEGLLSKMECREVQLQDEEISELLLAREKGGDRPVLLGGCSRAHRYLWSHWEQLSCQDGLLYKRYEAGEKVSHQLVCPRAWRATILREAHEGVMGGHLGVEKCLSKVRERFWWYGLEGEVRRWCYSCLVCAKLKSKNRKRRGPLGTVKPGYKLERVAIDILGGLPTSNAGNKVIMVVTDCFTKWVTAYAMPDHTAKTVADHLVRDFMCNFGVPEVIHTDRGADFESKLMKEVCDVLGIKKTRTTPYHPQSDGLVERYNRTLIEMLKPYVSKNHRDWDDCLAGVLMAYRSTVHCSTGFTPHYLMFGQEATLPMDVMFGGGWKQRCETIGEYAGNMAKRLEEGYKLVRERLSDAHRRQKEVYDRKVVGGRFVVGDQVLVYSPGAERGQCRKLVGKYEGPYTVEKVLSDVTYVVKIAGRRAKTQHFNNLLPAPVENPMRKELESLQGGGDDAASEFEILDEEVREMDLQEDEDEEVELQEGNAEEDVVVGEAVQEEVVRPVVRARSGREVRLNPRYNDYVME